jgi:uncharacterized protein (TIGR01244 family)
VICRILLLTLLALSPASSQPTRNAFGNPSPEVFESPDRDAWQHPDWVLDQLRLNPGQTVADVGAGSGYFSRRIARRVGSEGRVFAVDIDPEMLAFTANLAARAGITNIDTIRVDPGGGPGLAPSSVDLIFICNTLHHIRNRPTYYPKLIEALRPGGRIVVIDFYKRDLPVGPRDLDHKLAKARVRAEFTKAGLFIQQDLEGLPYQYFLISSPLPAIKNAGLLDERTLVSGQPTDGQFAELKAMGFKTILNLRTEKEGSEAEGRVVTDLGLNYLNVPIEASQITDEQIDLFSQTLMNDANYPMVVHCGSANRVGGLILLHRVLKENVEPEEALLEARRVGLRSALEKLLIKRLSESR